ncbi:MAG: U32 family peptidase [Gammaproteobacteria bacterium]|nr:U32 family peptidase [Gammaproteobacteria bacterium]
MNKTFELLAPGGDIDSIMAAIVAGADAIYCGLDSFNARNRATNISFDDLNAVLKVAHQHNCRIFLTLNIIILEQEIPALLRLLNKLVNTRIDGVIVQDLGLFYLLSKYFPTLDVHASTQVTTHNEGQIHFLNKLGVSRANLSRELAIDEIKAITTIAHKNDILTEVFVHGSNCIGFSGLCYISSASGGNSGNRGRCSQPCRDQYQTTRAGKDFPLNLKDNSAFFDIENLSDAGVDSLKIEGRVKKPHYVYTVVDNWRKQLDNFSLKGESLKDNSELYKVFNRDFSNAFLEGDINKNMYIDNPRDNSVKHFVKVKDYKSDEEMQTLKKQLYDDKTDIINVVKDKTKDLNLDKTLLTIIISGEVNTPLIVTVKSIDSTFTVNSSSPLVQVAKSNTSINELEKKFRGLANSLYQISAINIDKLQADLFIPFKELTTIKNKLAFLLNDSKEIIPPVVLPKFKRLNRKTDKPKLSVLISSKKDIPLCDTTSSEIFYQLPDCIENAFDELVDMFLENKQLIPWFPSIIMDNDYIASVEFLKIVKPERIITNNSGIAHAAFKNNINWIAGPHLNTTNSYSLLSMKENFNCSGSFISNEISRRQLQHIVCPKDFKLYYSIYHPILLLASRQCLFHQTSGCKKNTMDEECLPKCKKFTSITNLKSANLKETTFMINKKNNEHNCMYNNLNFLNTDIIDEVSELFSGFLIDLRDIKTQTNMIRDKNSIVLQFESLLIGNYDAKTRLFESIKPTTNKQYSIGLR